MLYQAIDQHCKQLTVNIRNEAGDVIVKREVSTEWKRVREYLKELQERSEPEGGYVTIVEVCGFNDWLLKLLKEYGCRQIILVQPKKRSKKKTDRRDANELGEILWVNRERLLAGKKVNGIRRVVLPTEQDAQDRQITLARKRLGDQHTRTINRIRHILRKHNLQQECPTKGINTLKARRWLAELSLGPIDRLIMDQLLVQWKLWDEQLEKVQGEIEKRQPNNKSALLLATIPGCRAYSSLALASRIGDIERFPRPGSLPNYWGLTPSCRNSGGATERLGSITKEGSAMARFILGELVHPVLRSDPWMKRWYGKIKRRRGAKIARVAVMRRLSSICEQMIKHNEPYAVGGPSQRQARPQPSEDHGTRAATSDLERHGKVSKGPKKQQAPAARASSNKGNGRDVAASDLERHGKVSKGPKKQPLAGTSHRRPKRALGAP